MSKSILSSLKNGKVAKGPNENVRYGPAKAALNHLKSTIYISVLRNYVNWTLNCNRSVYRSAVIFYKVFFAFGEDPIHLNSFSFCSTNG